MTEIQMSLETVRETLAENLKALAMVEMSRTVDPERRDRFIARSAYALSRFAIHLNDAGAMAVTLAHMRVLCEKFPDNLSVVPAVAEAVTDYADKLSRPEYSHLLEKFGGFCDSIEASDKAGEEQKAQVADARAAINDVVSLYAKKVMAMPRQALESGDEISVKVALYRVSELWNRLEDSADVMQELGKAVRDNAEKIANSAAMVDELRSFCKVLEKSDPNDTQKGQIASVRDEIRRVAGMRRIKTQGPQFKFKDNAGKEAPPPADALKNFKN